MSKLPNALLPLLLISLFSTGCDKTQTPSIVVQTEFVRPSIPASLSSGCRNESEWPEKADTPEYRQALLDGILAGRDCRSKYYELLGIVQ